MVSVIWKSYDSGSAIGEHGSEGGEIVKDEELDSSSRITLEKFAGGHYAVTCGVYGTFVHTAWFGEENALLKYGQMKSDIETIILSENDDEFYRLIGEFADKY